MSIPGDQPNPYARQPQQPYQPAQQPQPSQQSQPSQPAPQPGQAPQQPYPGQPAPAPGPAQPESPYPPYGPQPTTSGYGQGEQHSTGNTAAPVGVSGLTLTGAPLGGPSAPPEPPRSRVPGWVWGVGGVVITSAVWAAAVISTGGFANEPDADLAGYHFHEDMCAALDRTALEKHHSSDSERESRSYTSQHEAVDSSTCVLRFGGDEDRDYATTLIDFTTTWHKKVDPAAEFEANAKAYDERDTDDNTYDVEAVDGVGQEAYLVTNTSQRNDSLNSVYLTARDGWVEARVDWTDMGQRDGSDTLSKDEVRDMLVASANDTLEKLKTNPSASEDAEESEESEEPGDSTDPGADDPGSDGPDATDPPRRGEGDI